MGLPYWLGKKENIGVIQTGNVIEIHSHVDILQLNKKTEEKEEKECATSSSSASFFFVVVVVVFSFLIRDLRFERDIQIVFACFKWSQETSVLFLRSSDLLESNKEGCRLRRDDWFIITNS